jgi:hypothetical protein
MNAVGGVPPALTPVSSPNDDTDSTIMDGRVKRGRNLYSECLFENRRIAADQENYE